MNTVQSSRFRCLQSVRSLAPVWAGWLWHTGCRPISLLESWSRNVMRLTLPVIFKVIDFLSLLLKISAGKWNTLVNFESASTRVDAQFSVGENGPVRISTPSLWRPKEPGS